MLDIAATKLRFFVLILELCFSESEFCRKDGEKATTYFAEVASNRLLQAKQSTTSI